MKTPIDRIFIIALHDDTAKRTNSVRTSPGQFVRLSTDQLAERDRVEVMREIFGRTIMKLEFEPLPRSPFAIDKVMRALPDCGISFGMISATDCRRTRQLIDSDDLIITVMLSGYGTLHVHGQEIPIGHGTAALSCSGDPHRFQIHTHAETVTFRFQRKHITPVPKNLDTVSRRLSSDGDAIRLLVSYAKILRQEDALYSSESESAVANHLYDLAALVLGAGRDRMEFATQRGVAAARLVEAKRMIAQCLTDPGLTPSKVAGAMGISVRQLHLLFEPSGITFGQHLKQLRVGLSRRILLDSVSHHRTIADIAFACGFHNLTTFYSAFRQAFHTTPDELRRRIHRP